MKHLTIRSMAVAVLGLAAVGCAAGSLVPSAEPTKRLRAYVTNVTSNTVSVIDLGEHYAIEHLPIGQMPRGVAVSPTGQEVYVASQQSNAVSIIRTLDNKVIATIPVDKGPYGVAVSPDGKEVYVTHAGTFPIFGTTVSVIDVKTRKVAATIPVGNQPIGIATSPDGKTAYVADQWGIDATATHPLSALSVIDTVTRTSRTVELDDGMATGIAVSPDGMYVYVAHEMPVGSIRVLRASDLTTVAKVTVGNGPFGVTVSPDGKFVYAANLGTAEGDETVSVIRTSDFTVVDTITVGKVPVGIAVTPDGREVLAVNRRSNTVSVIDAATRQVTHTIIVGEQPWGFGKFIGSVPVK